MYELTSSMLAGEEALKREKNRYLQNRIFNYTVDNLDRHICEKAKGHFSSTKEFLVDCFESKNVAFSRLWAEMNFQLGYLAVAFELEEVYPHHLCLAQTDGFYLLTDNNGPPQTCPCFVEHTRQGHLVIFLMLSGAEAMSLWMGY